MAVNEFENVRQTHWRWLMNQLGAGGDGIHWPPMYNPRVLINPAYLSEEMPMSEAEWLASEDPARMLELLSGNEVGPNSPVAWRQSMPSKGINRLSDRQLRLFACACCRQVWDGAEECPGTRAGPCCQTGLCPICNGTGKTGGLTDPRSRRAVEVTERFADGLATVRELDEANQDARRCWRHEDNYAGMAVYCGHGNAKFAAERITRPGLSGIDYVNQAAILRDIIGNPWVVTERLHRPKNAAVDKCWSRKRDPRLNERLMTFDEGWLAPTVVNLAHMIYDDRAFDLMPILADALEEAGCTDETILGHCWANGLGAPHVRGCWAISLILDQEKGT